MPENDENTGVTPPVETPTETPSNAVPTTSPIREGDGYGIYWGSGRPRVEATPTVENGTIKFNESNYEYTSSGAPMASTLMDSETALSGDYPLDNDGNYENYVDADSYDGYAKRVSHDTDNIAYRIYDHDYSPESAEYGVYINNSFTQTATIVVGQVKKYEVRARKTKTTVEDGQTVTTVTESWTDDIPGLIWVSMDTDKAEIVEGNKIHAIAAGKVEIRIYNNNETGYYARLVLTISNSTPQNSFTITV